MKKKFQVPLVIAFCCGIVLASCAVFQRETEVLVDRTVFTANYDTLLEELSQGNLDALEIYSKTFEYPPEEDGREDLGWGEDDFMLVAESINQIIQAESLEDWELLSAQNVVQCENVGQEFESARYKFLKIEISQNESFRRLSWIIIYPDSNFVEAYAYEYHPVVANWKSIPLTDLKISATDALAIVEENGGAEVRSQNGNECEVLANFRNRVWEIWYSDSENDTLAIFVVHPESGNFKRDD